MVGMFGFYERFFLCPPRQLFVSLGILMLTMLLNAAANSQNTDAKAIWYGLRTSAGNRQNGFLHEGASATLTGDGSPSADWWMT